MPYFGAVKFSWRFGYALGKSQLNLIASWFPPPSIIIMLYFVFKKKTLKELNQHLSLEIKKKNYTDVLAAIELKY